MRLTGGLPQHFADEMGALLGPDFPACLGLAVSGGGDSMAMLHLAAGWARTYGIALRVITIDHGLRAESRAEAALVADECAGLDLPHDILLWEGWDGRGNLMEVAREARLTLIDRWRGDIQHVLFAHTRDDQAETLLMRLARGSGVEGLAAMRAERRVNGTVDQGVQSAESRANGWTLLRPLLGVSRADLRHYADTLRIPYVDDPTNDDDSFARVRMRRLIGQEGLDAETLAATAGRMARATVALRARAYDVATRLHRPVMDGIVTLDRDGLAAIEAETQLRIIAGALQSVTGAAHRPRLSALEGAVEQVSSGAAATVHGAILVPQAGCLHIAREWNAVSDLSTPIGRPWDGRWRIEGAAIEGGRIAALGQAGWSQITPVRSDRPPQSALLSLPAVWQGETVVACPPLDHGLGYVAQLLPSGGNFPQVLLGN